MSGGGGLEGFRGSQGPFQDKVQAAAPDINLNLPTGAIHPTPGPSGVGMNNIFMQQANQQGTLLVSVN